MVDDQRADALRAAIELRNIDAAPLNETQKLGLVYAQQLTVSLANLDRRYRHSITKCRLQRRRSSGNQSGHRLFQLRQPHRARPWLFYRRRHSWPITQ